MKILRGGKQKDLRNFYEKDGKKNRFRVARHCRGNRCGIFCLDGI